MIYGQSASDDWRCADDTCGLSSVEKRTRDTYVFVVRFYNFVIDRRPLIGFFRFENIDAQYVNQIFPIDIQTSDGDEI